MLDFIRKLTKSRFGAMFGVAFVILLGLAFAGTDVTGLRSGPLSGVERAATVGGTPVTTAEVEKTLRAAFDAQRAQNPALTLKGVVAQGAVDQVLDGLVERVAMAEWARRNGMGVSDRLVDSEIAKLPAFQGPDGKFSQDVYTQLITQRGLTDRQVRDDLGKSLIARQLLVPASFGTTMPAGVAARYAALLKEKRTGTIQIVPSTAFAPKAPATDQQLAAYYKAHAAAYMRPERRTIRYAVLDAAAVKAVPPPTDAEIAARYKRDAALYAASETRDVTQVVVPTEAAARALIAKGEPLAAAARAAGLSASPLKAQTREGYAAQSAAPVAAAVFGAAQAGFVAPVKGPLGWYVIHVDAIIRKPGKTLDQAREALVTAITADKRRAALADLSTKAEEQFENGAGLADVARSMGLTIATTEPLDASGAVYGKPGQMAPGVVLQLVQAAFAVEREGQGQIGDVGKGEAFALFDVGQIVPAAPAPLADIREQVVRDYARDQGWAAARSAADRIMAALARKTALADAIRTGGAALPPAQPVTMTREQMMGLQPRIPAPLALMFAMAKGSAKRLEAPDHAGWLVITLDAVEPGTLPANDPSITAAARELSRIVSRELGDQLRAAIRAEVGVKKQPKAVADLTRRLAGDQ